MRPQGLSTEAAHRAKEETEKKEEEKVKGIVEGNNNSNNNNSASSNSSVGKKPHKKKLKKENMKKELSEKRKEAIRELTDKVDYSPLAIDLRLLAYFKKNGCDSIRYGQLQDVILHFLGGVDKDLPKWIGIRGKKNISKVVFLIINSLDVDVYVNYSQYLPNLMRIFPESISTRAAGCKHTVFSPVHSILQCPLSRKQRKKREEELAKYDYSKNFNVEDFLITAEQKEENGFPMRRPAVPIPGDVYDYEFFNDYVSTIPSPSPAQAIKVGSLKRDQLMLFAVDCEMCKTERGFELTRVSVVDEKKNVVYDRFVMPELPILDYCTQYSGITAKLLAENPCLNLKEVQKDLLKLIPAEAILIGHSFENDLRALQIVHENVIDTSLIYTHTRGPPFRPSLKWLSEKYLGRAIQNQASGHDSRQDAVAALELALLKLEHGPMFGETAEETEPLTELLARNGKRSFLIDLPTVTRKFAQGKAMVQYATVSSGNGDGPSPSMTTDEQVVAKCSEVFAQSQTGSESEEKPFVPGSNADFVFAHIRGIQNFYKAAEDKVPSTVQGAGADGEDSSTPMITDMDEEGLIAVLKKVDAQVNSIHASLPPNSVFMVTTGHGNMIPVAKMKAKKNVAKEHWTEFHDAELDKIVAKARSCLSFICHT